MIVRLSTGHPVIHMLTLTGFARDRVCPTLGPMTTATLAVGAYGERLAVAHLVDAGLRIVARNWRCSDGEIDIIAWDGDDIVFCEVKTRRGLGFGSPAEAVVVAKTRRLRRLALLWLTAHDVHPREIRFDVVSVLPQRRGAARVEHVRGAF
jgi:putative endonuclease